MESFQEDLKRLPESFRGNEQVKLLDLCHQFTLEVEELTRGSSSYPSFFQDLHVKFLRLKKEIIRTQPSFEIGGNEVLEKQDKVSRITPGRVQNQTASTVTHSPTTKALSPELKGRVRQESDGLHLCELII